MIETSNAPQPDAKPIAVVTGASEGIGYEIARELARLGHALVLVARGEAALQAAADAIAREHGVLAIPLALDLTEAGACARLDAAVAGLGGHIEILVNNAGTGFSGPFDTMPPEAVSGMLDLNVKAVALLCRHVLPGMRARRCGSIVNIASLGGMVPGPWQALYYASKAFVVSFSEALADEIALDGIRVTVVAPGPVETAFHAKMGAQASFYRRFIPAPSPRTVARAALLGHRLGLRLVIPDACSLATFPFLRFMPHRLLIPIVGWLLKPRRQEGD